jgi:hypothetical protein
MPKNALLALPAPGPAGGGRYTSIVIPQVTDDGRFIELRHKPHDRSQDSANAAGIFIAFFVISLPIAYFGFSGHPDLGRIAYIGFVVCAFLLVGAVTSVAILLSPRLAEDELSDARPWLVYDRESKELCLPRVPLTLVPGENDFLRCVIRQPHARCELQFVQRTGQNLKSFDLLKRLGRMESTLEALTERCPLRVILYEARSTSRTTDFDVVEMYGGETREVGRQLGERST